MTTKTKPTRLSEALIREGLDQIEADPDLLKALLEVDPAKVKERERKQKEEKKKG